MNNDYIGIAVVIRGKLLQDTFHAPEHLANRGLRFANRTLRLLFIRSKALIGCVSRTKKFEKISVPIQLNGIRLLQENYFKVKDIDY